MAGRFAPSPSGDLHVGNLRTALIAWLSARSSGVPFLVRIDDLDPATSSDEHAAAQLRDLAAIGIDWDGEVVRQRDRRERYGEVIDTLIGSGRTYPCYCSRREIREAAAAPHGEAPDGAYPGTCRRLTVRQRSERARHRSSALRLMTGGEMWAVDDEVAGRYVGCIDDFVLRRNDGVPAYNLAVVVDDVDQHVTQVVRGDDLLSSTPRHVLVQRLLGAPTPRYLHVPLVTGPDGRRLAKRDGAVTLTGLAALGVTARQVRAALETSIGLRAPADVLTSAQRLAAAGWRSLAGEPLPIGMLATW